MDGNTFILFFSIYSEQKEKKSSIAILNIQTEKKKYKTKHTKTKQIKKQKLIQYNNKCRKSSYVYLLNLQYFSAFPYSFIIKADRNWKRRKKDVIISNLLCLGLLSSFYVTLLSFEIRIIVDYYLLQNSSHSTDSARFVFLPNENQRFWKFPNIFRIRKNYEYRPPISKLDGI